MLSLTVVIIILLGVKLKTWATIHIYEVDNYFGTI